MNDSNGAPPSSRNGLLHLEAIARVKSHLASPSTSDPIRLLSPFNLREAPSPLENGGIRAFLSTFSEVGPFFVIPIFDGTNIVGRPRGGGQDRIFVESSEWKIECLNQTARVLDCDSTNQSYLIPRDEFASLAPGFSPKFSDCMPPGRLGRRLEWRSEQWFALEEGDVLVNPYEAFVFGFATIEK